MNTPFDATSEPSGVFADIGWYMAATASRGSTRLKNLFFMVILSPQFELA
jgi:hypothetical protein